MGCTCCHQREDFASRALVAQERLGCANPARVSATMKGLCGRLSAFGTCSCPALDRPEQGKFIIGSARLC